MKTTNLSDLTSDEIVYLFITKPELERREREAAKQRDFVRRFNKSLNNYPPEVTIHYAGGPFQGLFVWDSGRDCDGVEYGHVHFVQCSSIEEYQAAYDEAAAWADGPFGWSIIPPGDSDLVEAFESEYSIDRFAEAAGY